MQADPPRAEPTPVGSRTTAGVVVIGNEVLSAKVADANGPQILNSLVNLGVRVGELAIVADDVDRIATVVADFSRRFSFVITTGGVGPTHDDCTWKAVSQAFAAPMVFRAELAEKLREFVGADLTPEQRRLAHLPLDALVVPVVGRWPLFRMRNVYVLPGVPALVAKNLKQIELLCREQGVCGPALATAYFTVDEWLAVAHIDAVVAAHSDVEIGSYPVFDAPDYRLRLTFEHLDAQRVQAAVDAIVQAIGVAQWVRTQWGRSP